MTEGVALRGLVKSFKAGGNTVQAVRNLDLDIALGQTVALLGPNGAGKSTTLDMLLGLTKPDAGTVQVMGMSPRDAVAKGAIGAMLQTGAVLKDLTVRELVTMMGALYPKPLPVDEVLNQVAITDIADRPTNKLSGGQTQRVRFAVALVSNPTLLVLDEPTVAMDVEARRDFWSAMRTLAGSGRTVVFATHYLEEADAFADRIVLMDRGEIVADGPATEIKAMVGSRTIRATLPYVQSDSLQRLAGVTSVELHGETAILTCSDSDAAIRALLSAYPQAKDIEIAGAGLEQAFLALTGEAR